MVDESAWILKALCVKSDKVKDNSTAQCLSVFL
jgi:hypothetical protein